MSTLKTNNVQVGQSVTATNNFTLYQPSTPDGTVRLGVGNTGATTADVLVANSSSQVMVGTATPSTGAALTVNGSIKGTITSGTSQTAPPATPQYFDFTGIPSWVKRITVIFQGVSGSGTSSKLVQLGDAGGIEDTGYLSTSSLLGSASGVTASSTAGFICNSASASEVISVIFTIVNISGNAWVSSYTGKVAASTTCYGGGDKTLSGTLDRVRITTVNGTDTFDAGTINILYEG